MDKQDVPGTRENVDPLQKGETWLPKTWRRLRYSMAFLSQFSLASAPATLPKSQQAKARNGRMNNHTIHYRRRSGSRPSKEPEGAQVHGT